MIIGIMLLFVFSGQFSFTPHTHIVIDHISPEIFAIEYGFTEKETEVFIASLEHGGNVSELADKLFISRSVLYKHFQKIQEKTGQDSYQAVKNLYYSTRVPNKLIIKTPVEESSSTDSLNKETSNNSSLIKDSAVNDNADKDSSNREKINKESSIEEKINDFATTYSLSDSEKTALRLLIENPHKTQKELAEMQGVTLRTMQRYLASLRNKTGAKSLGELSAMITK